MTDHLHGLCKNCLPQCRQILNVGKNQDECSRCNDAEPTVIVQEDGVTVAICTRCYLRECSSPKKSQLSKLKPASQLSKTQQSTHSNVQKEFQYLYLVAKSEFLSKGFFSSEGKMMRRVDKYLSGHADVILKELLKKSLVNSPIGWEKLISKVQKVGSLAYVFVSKAHIFGFFHYEPCKVGERGFEDSQSGCFISPRSKIDLQFHRGATENMVIYSPQSKSVKIGKPTCCQTIFSGDSKIKCELVPQNSEWIYQFIVKV